MNFSDFGVKDESELEQDEFSLSRPQFGKDNQLTVIGWKNRIKSNKCYIVKCTKCSKDPGLFGDGVFKALKSLLLRESLPCGCPTTFRWSETQYKTLVSRQCIEGGYLFHGFNEDFKGQNTKLKLECQKHGTWATASLSSLLNNKTGCPKCVPEKIRKAKRKEDSLQTTTFMATGKFKDGTRFWRSNRLSKRGWMCYWNYTCPVCSNDEYVKAGLCSGIFEIKGAGLTKGSLVCRCSPRYTWSEDQYRYRIEKKMLESKTTDDFVGFINGFKNKDSKFSRKCVSHGLYETSATAYLSDNHSCPQCANQTQQEAYINFIKDTGITISLKFGITNDSVIRVKQHNSKSIFDIELFAVWEFPTVKSCKAAERYIKKHLPCRFLTKQEMPDGYTETTSIENLETIIKIYEDFGGVRKIIESENLLEDKSL